MCLSASEKIPNIAVSNLRHNFLPHFILAVLLLLLTPFVFGTANVDAKTAAIPLEMFVSMIGIILLTPVFLPEQSGGIRDVVESKATAPVFVYSIRIGIALLSMLALIAAFVLYMKENGCAVSLVSAVFGTFSSSVFLGAFGLFVYGISDTLIVGYMAPMVYYMLNLFGGKKYLGELYLFSMSSGSIVEKYWLISMGMVLILSVLFIKSKLVHH